MTILARVPIEQVVDYETRERWLQARQGGVGASESAALFGISPYSSRFKLWLEKTGRAPQWEPNGDQAERLAWGLALEEPIANEYEKRSKRRLWRFSPYCIAQHPDVEEMFATPDGFILEAPDRPGEGTLQIKNTANVWSPDGWGEGVPLHVQCQVQHELACTGRDWATVVALANGCKLKTWDVPRDDEFIGTLVDEVRLFWRDVREDRMPPADGHPETLAALKRLHPLDNGETIILPAEAMVLWDELLLARAAMSAAEQKRDAAEARLKQLMGPNTFGKLVDGRTLSFKTTQNPGYTPGPVLPYSYRVLREIKASAVSKHHKTKGKAA
jgi:putative phage-type endonuclease